ncbi:MAG: tetratricopeptide repeat protein [Myxococcales bacterium]|nr:tetratricopeptide repeat protein [Myxococcales bacterium]
MADRLGSLTRLPPPVAGRLVPARLVIAPLFVVCLLAAPATAVAGAIEDAAVACARGDYDAALEALEHVPAADAARARVVRALALERTGRDADAVAELRAAVDARAGGTPEERVALGRLLVATGAYDQAIAVLDPIVEADSPCPPAARYWRAVAFEGIGRRSRSQLELEDLARMQLRGEADSAEALLYAALAWERLDRFDDANAVFARALDADPNSVEVRVAWARLFLEKYRPDEAKRLVEEALALNPRHSDALALAARVALALSGDPRQARRFADEALAIDADLPEAEEILASMAIDDQEYLRALELLAPVRARSPHRMSALALEGAVAYLRDDTEAYERTTAEALSLGTAAAEYFYVVGQHASSAFRYADGLALQQRALEVDGGFWPALVELGIGFSRVGDDRRALAELRRAFDADPFNIQAFTMVELWEGALNDYRTIEDPEIPGLSYRFHRDERRVLEAYVPDVIRDAWRRYAAQYGVDPERPVSIEVFRDGETFSVRSVGLPWTMQSGICFGHVVTARSPSEQPFNWRQTLEHELSHVFSLNASRARVPRWFTEGLAEYDTIRAREQWRREEDLSMVRALQSNTVVPVAGLNRAFVQFERPEQVLDAYYQASLLVEFIGERWGYPTVVAMLEAWGRSLSTPDVIQTTLGVTEAELDAAFESAMREHFAPMLSLLEPTEWSYSVADEAAVVEAHPSDPAALARLAWARLGAGDAPAALTAARASLELDPRNPLANLFVGRVATASGQPIDALAAYEAVFAAGVESLTGRVGAATAATELGRRADAIEHLRAAIELAPRAPEPRRLLVAALAAEGDDAGAIEQREAIAALDEHDFDTPMELARTFLQRGELAQAARYAELAANVNPFSRDLHTLYGRVAHDTGQWQIARRELELELELGPENRRETLARLADTYEALGLAELAATTRNAIAP